MSPEEAADYHQAAATVKGLSLPALPCPVCGVVAVPTLGPGSGKHVSRALCPQGHFIKWLPKALVGGEQAMTANVNRVILVGIMGKYGASLSYKTSGMACATFTLELREQGADGKTYSTLIPCEVWGKKAEAASELEAGRLCLFEGKLAKRKKDAQWEIIVSGFDLTPVLAPQQVSLTGRTN
jgi:hypothetical protein